MSAPSLFGAWVIARWSITTANACPLTDLPHPPFFFSRAPARRCEPRLPYAEHVPAISLLECSRCQQHVSAATAQTVCPSCSAPLLVRYDLKKTAKRPGPDAPSSIWRYAGVLPDVAPVSLGEGWTPLLPSRRYPALFVKEEAHNPTGSFKARGMSVAISMARHYGLKKLAIASAGNAASALAAYAASAGIDAHIFMPRNAATANYLEANAHGAHVELIDGSLADCRRILAQRQAAEGWFDLSSLNEPFRLEGDKTIVCELVEQLGWTYPDALVFPTTAALLGIWKAFDEMEQLGWVSGKRPKIIETSGGAPSSDGLKSLSEIVGASGGTILDLPREAVHTSLLDWARNEGVLLCPEGAAAAAGYAQLIDTGSLRPTDRVVLLNPASGLKYIDNVAEALHLKRPAAKQYPQRTAVGGIITPQ